MSTTDHELSGHELSESDDELRDAHEAHEAYANSDKSVYDEVPGTTSADVVTWIFAGVMTAATVWCILFVM
ncbi:MAG TPA: hypothetical protein H9870_09285 [Candidatus Corynebacterium avicola]|uniref:Uncharacterized protein n=1 Tax=Candidatus Corynebacterium avicola TaxID=2838527 RepID=A0A9D1RS74_9CORY|nr:hypothetical protein [Candidatus Corynebacterium avicola]